MEIGILGTGMVGQTIGSKLVQLGHIVKMGSRTANNEKAIDWVKSNGPNASCGTFEDAASFGEILFNCTAGNASINALKLANENNFNGKILLDIANTLDFSKGMPPMLSVCNDDSLGEQIQRTFPQLKVIKTLNTMNCKLMVDPSLVNGDHDIFVSGNDLAAKEKVKSILADWFGWKSIIDLGDISAARGMEMLLPIWIRLMGIFKTPNFNFKIAR
ncbi:MAG: NAD(P)-binding domain-containing protein [Ignavibacteriaceae bacterium]|jgi:predicted dinucleotide-binding enzyme